MGKWLKALGLELEPVEERALEVVDIGIAFDQAIVEATQGAGSSLPTVFRASQFITDTAASLHMEQIGSSGRVEESPFLQNPDPTATFHDFMSRTMASLIWRGNAYFRPTGRNSVGNITAISVLDPDEVSVQWDRNRIHRQYAWRNRTMIADSDIFHISMNLLPGEVEGRGPIEAARMFLAGAAAQDTFMRVLFEDNATPSFIIKVAQKLTSDEAEEVRDIWEGKHKNRKRPAVTSGGIEATPITISPVDAQFVELANFTTQQIATLFGLDGWFLNTSSGGSMVYQNVEFLMRNFLTTTLRPTYLERIEQTFSRMLPRSKRAKFNTSEITEADTKSQYEALGLAVNNRLMTVNEARKILGLQPVAGGDAIASSTSSSPPATSSNGNAPVQELINA